MPDSLDPHARRELPSADARLSAKALDAAAPADTGWLEGYAAVFGNVDKQQEMIEPGAFARSIGQAVAAGKVKLMVRHYRDGGDALECVGTVTQAREDAHGLWVHAEFSGGGVAQDARRLVAEGHVSGLSIGYRPVRFDFADGVIRHREVALLEVTITNRPANPAAQVVAAKSAPLAPAAAVSAPAPTTGARAWEMTLGTMRARQTLRREWLAAQRA